MQGREYIPLGGRLTMQSNGLYLDNERFIIIPLRSYGAIIEAMRDLVGDMAAGPLYYLGKKIGLGLVDEVSKRVKRATVEEVARALDRLLEELGFGSISIIDAGEDTATLKLYSPPSMIGMRIVAGRERSVGGGGSRGFCHLERGMMAAVFERLLGRRVRVLEAGHGEEGGKPYCIVKLVALDPF